MLSPGVHEMLDYPMGLDISHTLSLPHDCVLVISFQRLRLYHKYQESCNLDIDDFLEITTHTEIQTNTSLRLCGVQGIHSLIFNNSITLRFVSHTVDTRHARQSAGGFKLQFSIHLANESLTRHSSGLFDCSKHYAAFQGHLGCNFKQECQGGEDETEDCPYTSEQCGPEEMFVQGKCINLHAMPPPSTRPHDEVTGDEARQACQREGRALATLRTQQEMDMLRYLADHGPRTSLAFVGLHNKPSGLNMYRRVWFWADGTPDFYNRNMHYSDYSMTDYLCAFVSIYPPFKFHVIGCSLPRLKWGLCENKTQMQKSTSTVQFQQKPERTKALSSVNLSLLVCPGHHFTHDFLSCDPAGHCKTTNHVSICEFAISEEVTNQTTTTANQVRHYVEMFQCEKYGETIHYTLVCDFRHDCSDNSDESRCQHREHSTGLEFRCNNGQMIDVDRVCDMLDDCLDSSDEQLCDYYNTQNSDNFSTPQPPVVIHMVGHGSFTTEALEPADQTCPETHFRCPGKDVYCMPVFLRCNKVTDCLGGEDEVSCDDVTCPGYYRCRSSSVCLHDNHLCDGWPQCPERDDELLCNATCPAGCYCQGLAFVCHNPFPVERHKDIKYLDATGSGIGPGDVANIFYLVYLNLAACRLQVWPEIVFHNLQKLDLSDNDFSVFYTISLQLLSNLRFLSLKENPLTVMLNEQSRIQHGFLRVLDLSQTLVTQTDDTALDAFPQIQHLNLSFSSLRKINNNGFTNLSYLMTIDLKGCEVVEFPSDVFDGMGDLNLIYAKNYKLCCKATLPKGFNTKNCFAPVDEISSCQDLLKSDIYRGFLWAVSVMSVVGNVSSFVFKVIFQRSEMFKLGFNVFVLNLGFSDMIMGVYLVMIGAADVLYRDNYVWHETAWRSSVVCKMAGFFSLLSNEVSAFMICLITLDRFIVLQFPFSTKRFKGRSAMSASVLAWTVGVLLAIVPLMSFLSHWSFYGQTGMCIPLPVTRQTFVGKMYSFSVMIVFNFILFLLIAIGQFFIYRSIRSNSMTVSENTSQSQNLTIARRLITVVVSDFLCWFPIGLLGLIANSGTPIPGEVNVALAIFVLPLNSALNPFLYTYNTLMEKRRLKKEAKLLKQIHALILDQNKEN